jgi:hypothetical protein
MSKTHQQILKRSRLSAEAIALTIYCSYLMFTEDGEPYTPEDTYQLVEWLKL